MNKPVKCYIPIGAETTVQHKVLPHLVRYKKNKSINPYNKAAKDVAKSIQHTNPDLVWYVDNAIFTSQVGILLAKKVKQALIMHDAGTSHSTYNKSFYQKIKALIGVSLSKLCNDYMNRIVLCSPSSLNMYCKLYPSHKNKVYMLPLGAHMPNAFPKCPPEICNVKSPLLFFGRIDRYKGIDTLIRTYSQWGGERCLVIAGKGKILDKELNDIQKNPQIILINRFISDEEMVYLFNEARALVLPYKDATQSGIIPIAYSCGKPVITSNVEGLAQFVEQKKTGFICKNDDEYINAYNYIENDAQVECFSKNVKSYYLKNLQWEETVMKFLKLNLSET